MAQKIILIVLVILSAAAGVISVNFYIKSSNLEVWVEQSKALLKKFEEDIERVESEKKEIIKENEKFQSDTVYYTKFTVELQSQLQESEKSIKEKEDGMNNLNEKIQTLEDALVEKEKMNNSQKTLLSKERSQLSEKVKSLEDTLKKERGLYYYNLGVAYVGAKHFDKAVDAYEKSLSFESDNPEAHYNLGLLYENFNLSPEKAILHYQKYLKLKPDAADKNEVLSWVKKLNDIIYQRVFP